MPEPKTRPTDASVATFLDAIPDVVRCADAKTVAALMSAVSGCEPTMWGESIVGYGTIAYQGSRGKEIPWPLIGFSPRKANLVLYLNAAVEPEAFAALGKHRRGVGCLYLKRLADIDLDALRRILGRSVELATA